MSIRPDDIPVATSPVIDALGELTRAILEATSRREEPAPELFRINVLNRTHTKLRVVTWIVTADNAAPTAVTLQVGTSVVATVLLSLETPTLFVPMPITIERGQDVVAAGGELVDSWLIAYTE